MELTQEAFDTLTAQNAELTKTNGELTDSTTAMQGKMDELLGETKKAKQQRQEADNAAAKSEREKAEKAGDYQQLHADSEKQRLGLQDQLDTMQAKNDAKDRQNAAMIMASDLAEGPNIEHMADFIGRRLKVTDDGLKVTDTAGNLTVSTVDDLKKEFAADTRYASLLKGNQSSGGGAAGSGSGGGAAGGQSITREQLAAMDPAATMKFFKGGGTLTE